MATVKDFGAIGDGVANDTPAFLKALVAAKTSGEIYVPAGTYLLEEPLRAGAETISRDQAELHQNF